MSDAPQPEEQALPPFVIEGARSSRSKCKTCRRRINQDVLRLGVLIEGPYGLGYLWHHLTCAARRQPDKVQEAYELEAWNKAKSPPSKVPPIEELMALREKAEVQKKAQKTIPYAEADPSGRARCKHCEERIEKGSLRVVLGREVAFGNQVRVGPVNVHPRCVAAEMRSEESATEPEGFEGELRANSADLPAERIDEVLAEIGSLAG